MAAADNPAPRHEGVHYIYLMKLTPEGRAQVSDLVKRGEEFRQSAQDVGGQVTAYFATLGEFDLVGIAKVPDDESAMLLALALAKRGFVTTTTLKAFEAGIIPWLGNNIRQ